ncbi:short subunit dehydrogenase [Saccharopolyspora erythraea NRRL 2338]|uniref:Thioester reductase (TE) domain-containing protein n=1 Tax=Saccharopolyspora erythraea TaxID=1836 RepID=A0ABN1CAT3_SACER|nr:SDR family oxidoreductase [Saccharopolyspora erythraea]PFG96962.1 short subunit dehydrogenase [Saccharopolyspora erythraea NRRL 2338]QRK87180.1 SDR family NAD(P)-dependent oxidoreductase [Saccharopolyspora erythraea]
MTGYLVTGATGFPGRRLVRRLVRRPDREVVHVLVREQSRHRVAELFDVTTQGLQSHAPRFSAYLASKAALEEFGRAAGLDALCDGITFSSVRLPLVRTDMAAQWLARDEPAGGRPAGDPRGREAAGDGKRDAADLHGGSNRQCARAEDGARRRPPRGFQAMRDSAPEARDQPHPGVLPAVAGALTRLLWRKLT